MAAVRSNLDTTAVYEKSCLGDLSRLGGGAPGLPPYRWLPAGTGAAKTAAVRSNLDITAVYEKSCLGDPSRPRHGALGFPPYRWLAAGTGAAKIAAVRSNHDTTAFYKAGSPEVGKRGGTRRLRFSALFF